MTWGERINNGKTSVTEQTDEIVETLTGLPTIALADVKVPVVVEPTHLLTAIRQAFLKGYQAHFRKETQP